MAETHLDDDLLSAHLDGEITAAEGALVASHLETCGGCGARLSQLQGATTLLLRPPDVDPIRRDAAIRQALEAAAGTAVLDLPGTRAHRGGSWARAARWLAPAAAALVAVAIAVPLLRDGDGTPDHLAVAPVDAGYLGEFADTRTLTDELRALAGDRAAERSEALANGATSAEVAPAAGGYGVEGAPGGGTGGTDSPGAEATGPIAADAKTVTEPAPAVHARCLPRLEAEYGDADLGPVRVVASLDWNGTAAVAALHSLEGGDRSVVFVLAADDCRLLSFASF